jgi:2-polyprenyl-6-methoxyphenol hydroxylase-like FAD-dependent oxidoreductase
MGAVVRMRAVVIGGSVAGLASAVGLARRGWQVDVVERDPVPDAAGGDDAFASWSRPGVPQFRQPHAFTARSRTLLLEHIPEVVDLLRADGIEELNLFKALAPPDLWEAGDDDFTGLWSRRPGFELAIRRVAEVEPGVSLHCPGSAAGLLCDTPHGGPPHARGLRLADGTELLGDVVLDCGGRRTPVPGWLANDYGVHVPEEIQDCKAAYYTRHFRQTPSSNMSQLWLIGGVVQLDRLTALPFAGDHGAFGIGLFADPADKELRVLRHDWAFDAVVDSVPSLAPWVAPDNALPIGPTSSMAGHQNVRRHVVVDGKPLVHGLLPVGDSLCTTNPQYGWGASMALTYAFAAVVAADAHARNGDRDALLLSYDEAVRDEADGVYRESAAMDRMRIYDWDEIDVPAADRAEMDRQRLVRGIVAGALRDPVLGRAMLRRTNLLEPPERVLDDPEVVAHAQNTLDILAAKAPRRLGPSRDEMLEILARAAPPDAG